MRVASPETAEDAQDDAEETAGKRLKDDAGGENQPGKNYLTRIEGRKERNWLGLGKEKPGREGTGPGRRNWPFQRIGRAPGRRAISLRKVLTKEGKTRNWLFPLWGTRIWGGIGIGFFPKGGLGLIPKKTQKF